MKFALWIEGIDFSILRSVFIFTATNAIAASMPLLLLPVLTHALSPASYGLVAMFTVVLTGVGALTGLSVHGAVGIRYFDREEIDFPAYVGACLSILFVTTLVTFVLVFVLAEPLEALTALPRSWLLGAVIVSGFQFIILIRLSIYQSAKQPGRFAAVRLSQAAIDAVTTLIFVLVLVLSWQGRLAGMSLAMCLLGLASLLTLMTGGWVSLHLHREHIGHALRFGLPLIPHVMGGMMISMVDRFMITNVLDVSSTGIYMVAVQIGLGVYLLADGGSRAIQPWFIEGIKSGDDDKKRLMARMSILCFVGLASVAALVGLTAPWYLPFLVDEAFQKSAPLIIWIAMGQAFGGMYLVSANVIFYKQKTGYLAMITISSGLLNALLSFFLLQIEGLKGAAHAYFVAQLLMFAATFILAHKLHPLPWVSAWSGGSRSDE